MSPEASSFRGTGTGTDREAQSSRSALEREALKAKIEQLEAEVARLNRAVVGLGSLVAQAAVAGYIASRQPEGNENGTIKGTSTRL